MASTSPPPLTLVVGTAAAIAGAVYLFKQQRKSAQTAPVSLEGGKRWTAEELIAHRRSIYPDQYDQTKTVPRAVLEKMLESANWAPTHARTEPWRFVVFETLDARRRLGEFEAELYKSHVPADKFFQKKYDKKIKSKLASSYVIAICMKRQESERLPEIEEVCAVACAVQNMHLTATAHGVGAYWSSGPALDSHEMKEFLGLSQKDKCIGLFYVGVPKGDHPKGARKPMADKVKWL